MNKYVAKRLKNIKKNLRVRLLPIGNQSSELRRKIIVPLKKV